MNKADLDARQKIMLAGSKLFAKQGFEGTSTRDIAKESGVNLSLISYYFGGKEGLYQTVLNESAEQFKVRIVAMVSEFDTDSLTKEGFTQAILRLIDVFFEMREANPYVFSMFVREKLSGLPYSFDLYQNIFKIIGDKIEGLVLRGQKKGFIRKELQAHYFMGSLVETIMGNFMNYDCCDRLVKEVFVLNEDKEEFKKQMTYVYLEGIYQ